MTLEIRHIFLQVLLYITVYSNVHCIPIFLLFDVQMSNAFKLFLRAKKWLV